MEITKERIIAGFNEIVRTLQCLNDEAFSAYVKDAQNEKQEIYKSIEICISEDRRSDYLPPVLVLKDTDTVKISKRLSSLWELGYRMVGNITIHETGISGTIGHELFYVATMQLEAL